MKITLFKNDIPDEFYIEGDLAIDTETMGLNLSRDRLCLLQFSSGNNHAYLVQFTDKRYEAPNLKKLLLNINRSYIFHYARFDLLAIKKYLNLTIRGVFCTKIASKLVRTYTEHHGLKELCNELLGVNLSKAQQASYWGADTLTKEQQEYAAYDVMYLHAIRDILLQRLIDIDRLDLAQKLFEFLDTRIRLDELSWEDDYLLSYK